MRIFVVIAFVAVVLGMLFGPSLWLALSLRERGDAAALRSLRVVWPLQLMVAAVLYLWADWIGLRNPAGYTIAILVGVSLLGAAMLGVRWMSLRAWRYYASLPTVKGPRSSRER